MKKLFHIIYISIIVVLVILLVTKKTNIMNIVSSPSSSGDYADLPNYHWTYGINYQELMPLEQLESKDGDFRKFIKNLNKNVKNKKWDKVLEMCNKLHYDEQIEIVETNEQYILNNFQIYSLPGDGFVISNSLPAKEGGDYATLDQIKELKLIGTDPRQDNGDDFSVYGYVELENGIILASQLMITKQNGEYELTGPVG